MKKEFTGWKPTVYDRIFTEEDLAGGHEHPWVSDKQKVINDSIKEFMFSFGKLHKRKPLVVKFVCGFEIYICVGSVFAADMELRPTADWSIEPTRIILEVK